MLSNACQYFQKPDFEEMFPVFGHNILSLQVTSHVDRYDTGLLQGDHGVKYSVKSTATFTLHGKFSERVIRVYIDHFTRCKQHWSRSTSCFSFL